MQKYQKAIIVSILCLIFTAIFLRNTRHDFPLIFKKDLLAHDESSNSVVAANITRKFFPPTVRVNPLDEHQKIWMEGPYWQHIPPLFAYVPYLFFEIDDQITIEVKRLSFAFVTWLTVLLFIFSTYQFRKSIWTATAAAIAGVAWVNTPFTHELITGYAFGVSDIVLAFTVVCSFGAVLWYLRKEAEERIKYSSWQLVAVSLIVALPILAKNLLGAIPAATFFVLLLRDHRTVNKKVLASIGGFIAILLAYYLPLYFASPITFKSEILISFLHLDNLEGWGRPIHWYFINYLPQRYLLGWTWWYFAGLVFGIWYLVLSIKKREINRLDKILLSLSFGWFIWNLVTVSLVESKIANFIYQSYLLSLFFIFYSLSLLASRHPQRNKRSHVGFFPASLSFGEAGALLRTTIPAMLIVLVLFTGYQVVRFANQFKTQRTQAYNYQTEREKFYGSAEQMRELGINSNDLIIIRVSDNDCWFRYNVLFLTGAESKTLLEMFFGYDPNAVKQKYKQMYFVTNSEGSITLGSFKASEYNLENTTVDQIKNTIDAFVKKHEIDIRADIERIKDDKTSCQWLVPDEILNAD